MKIMHGISTFIEKEKEDSLFEKPTVVEMFDIALQLPNKEAAVFPTERVSYNQLADQSNQYAKALLSMGLRYGDKVGLFMPAGVENLVLLMACLRIGVIAVPINIRFKESEINYCVSNADIKVLFVQSAFNNYADYPKLVVKACSGIANGKFQENRLVRIVCLSQRNEEGCISRDEFIRYSSNIEDDALALASTNVDQDSAAFFVYTSGTTANPKAVILKHAHICSVIKTLADDYWQIRSTDVIWTPLPMYHIGGLIFFLFAVSIGAKFVHCEHFDALVSLRQMSEEKCTVAFPGFDTIWLDVVNCPGYETTNLDSIRMVNVVGASENLISFQTLLPNAHVVSSYGSSESIILAATRPEDSLKDRLTTCGTTLPFIKARIVDPESGIELENGERGELQFKSAFLFDGYYNDLELTRTSFSDDGWFRSGDLAVINGNGYLEFKGRIKDMIKVGGENVSAAEVENILISHPAVLRAQVVSAPDHKYGEVPAAFIQLAKGMHASQTEIVEFCSKKMARFKIPRYVRFVTEWPMSGTKVKKYVLRETIAKEIEQY